MNLKEYNNTNLNEEVRLLGNRRKMLDRLDKIIIVLLFLVTTAFLVAKWR